jgi:hypothetical protein
VSENLPRPGQLWISCGEIIRTKHEIRPGVWAIEWLSTAPAGTIRDFDPQTWIEGPYVGWRYSICGLPVEVMGVYHDGIDLNVVVNGEPHGDLGFELSPQNYELLRPLDMGGER